MKLWHDDIRKPPDSTWTWARTNAAAKEYLRLGRVTEASLDHDLGLDSMDASAPGAHRLRGSGPETGYDLAMWMVAKGLVPQVVTIHSHNPPGARRMAAALREAGGIVRVAPYVHGG